MAKILVVSYSRSGNTARVADALARALGADREELVDTVNRRGILGYLRSAFAARLGQPARIGPEHREPEGYDLVVVGSPVWAGSLSCAVRAYLARHRGGLPKVAFFLTHGGTSKDRVFAQMRAVGGTRPVAVMAVRERDLARGTDRALVERFAAELQQAVAAPAAAA
jgi:flavodoxin